MKKLAIILPLLFVAVLVLLFGSGKKDKQYKITPPPHQNRDEEMAGPRGEEIFIGSGGGRYYMKDGRRIYVGYKGRKQ